MPKLRNILLIDDDEITNFIGYDLITSMGITESVSVAVSGQEALDYLKNAYKDAANEASNTPELILLDMNMPEMDGLEFLEKINSIISGSRPLPVIIMLSTSFVEGDIAKAFAMNPMVKDYFEKPLTEEAIMHIYNSYLSDRG